METMSNVGARSYKIEVFEGPLDLLLNLISKNKLNIYSNDKIYQLKGSKRFNALKYVNIFNHFKNTEKGDPHGKFLGL